MTGNPARGSKPSALERFDELLRRVVAVPKSDLDKPAAAYKHPRARKKRSSK